MVRVPVAVPGDDPAAPAEPEIVAPPTPPQAKQEGIGDLLDALGRNVGPIVEIVRAFGEEVAKARTVHSSAKKRLSWMVFSFMVGTVLICAGLVYVGRMSDGALTFLLGIMVAYMLRVVDRLDFGGGSDDE